MDANIWLTSQSCHQPEENSRPQSTSTLSITSGGERQVATESGLPFDHQPAGSGDVRCAGRPAASSNGTVIEVLLLGVIHQTECRLIAAWSVTLLGISQDFPHIHGRYCKAHEVGNKQ